MSKLEQIGRSSEVGWSLLGPRCNRAGVEYIDTCIWDNTKGAILSMLINLLCKNSFSYVYIYVWNLSWKV